MKKVLAAKIEAECTGTGRAVGRSLAQSVKPGDMVDFTDFVTISNSFADEFVKCFIEIHSKEAFKNLNLINMGPLLETLIKRAVARRIHHVLPSPSASRPIPRKSLFRVSGNFA